MPAASSSPIDPAVPPARCRRFSGEDRVSVLSVLAAVSDPRARRGVRQRLSVIQALANSRCWPAHARSRRLRSGRLMLTRCLLPGSESPAAPCESTIRRTRQRLDAGALDDQVGAWAQQHTAPPTGRRRLVAADGKTLRGSCRGPARAVICSPRSITPRGYPAWTRSTCYDGSGRCACSVESADDLLTGATPDPGQRLRGNERQPVGIAPHRRIDATDATLARADDPVADHQDPNREHRLQALRPRPRRRIRVSPRARRPHAPDPDRAALVVPN
jgi:hypothetical protein